MNKLKVILLITFLLLAIFLLLDASFYLTNNYYNHKPEETYIYPEKQANISYQNEKEIIDRLRRLGYLT